MSDNSIIISNVNNFLTKIKESRCELEKELEAKEKPKEKFKAKDRGKLNFFYRGEDSDKYGLVPPIYRRKNGKKLYQDDTEKKILEEFAATCDEECGQDKSAFKRLLRAQHYGVPTRLLDVSLPLVALYFACKDKEEEKDKVENGRVRIFAAYDDVLVGAESGKLRIICNLAYLRDDDKTALDEISKTDKAFAAENAKKSAHYQKLLDSIRLECPNFADKIERHHLRNSFFVRPFYSNPRIRAQAGGFLASAFAEEYKAIIENRAFSKKYTSLSVEADKKREILDELDSLNINDMTLFPEMEHIANYLKGKYTHKDKKAGGESV